MRNIMSFKGHLNSEYGVVVTMLPPIPTPQERGESVEIPGRSGEVWKGEGAYSPITLTVPIWVSPDVSLTQVRGWLSGAGQLRFGDSAPYWEARVGGEVHFAPCTFNDGWTAAVSFVCQPFRFVESENIAITSNPQTVNNPYSVYSEPVITVQCEGDFSLIVGDVAVMMEDMGAGEVVFDCEMQECYRGNLLLNAYMSGAFPVLAAGKNEISYSGAVTGISIKTRWRTL